MAGVSLIEVLVTVLILGFGLLGLAGLQSKLSIGLLESKERAQALVMLTNLTERIDVNRQNAAAYVSTSPLGTGDQQPVDCTTTTTQAARDLCEWSHALKGFSATKDNEAVGTMPGMRGCIAQVQTADETSGVCRPAVYRVTVAWQGMHPTKAPAVNCANDAYGNDDKMRRAISTQISIGLQGCQ
ncbi:type IV pilus modification protein PilV [Noviherbaspirillum aerium]|uniref:type IV pilus modification protein PilV n=1 Tax=Noviherbaspirillum aerium TaxID=2588497 RepID=UPI001CEF7420|nr:type IV pilus modification protein PilV [Noviherbaspirillum aerium]